MKKITLLTTILLIIPLLLFSSIYYLDPINGSMSNDGSIEHPWTTVQEVIDSNLIETYEPFEYPYQEGDSLIKVNEGAPVKDRRYTAM